MQAGLATEEKSPEDEFHISDLGAIFKSKMFWIVALLCVLYYSAIFPFQRYATNFIEETLCIPNDEAAHLFSFFPVLAMLLTPLLGMFLDRVGKGASMLMAGACVMIVCHLSFAFLLPVLPYKWFATLLIVILGVSFSLVPAALWPSVPKIIDEKILGSALPCAGAHRQPAPGDRRISGSYDSIRKLRSPCLHLQHSPEERRQKERIRT